jgi:hypothetical protein
MNKSKREEEENLLIDDMSPSPLESIKPKKESKSILDNMEFEDTKNLLTNNFKNDRDGFYLVDYFDTEKYEGIENSYDDKKSLKLHLSQLKNINEDIYCRCDVILNEDYKNQKKSSDYYTKSFFLFYKGSLVSYKQCHFENKNGSILCFPYWTCSFTKILEQNKEIKEKFKEKSSVIVMLEKISECFKDKKLYFPIYLFASDKSCQAFLKNGFRIVLLDKEKMVMTPDKIDIFLEEYSRKDDKDAEYDDVLLKFIKKEKGQKLKNYLLPQTSSFFDSTNPFVEHKETLSCFLIFEKGNTKSRSKSR